ncbi:hypothetical protein MJD09_19515 [bacterium]|nr:hypothetical protein [bacterium]
MRHARHVSIALIAIALILPTLLSAQINFNGGRGLTYVHSAWTMSRGDLTLTTHSRMFSTNTTNPALPNPALTIWDVSSRFHLNYGLNENLEISATPTLYQDNNTPGTELSSSPHNVLVSLKYGSVTSPGSATALGAMVMTKLPLADAQNIPFEPYTVKRIGFGVMGLFSYSKDPLYPEGGTNVHVNIGYWNHNDDGVVFKGTTTKATSMSHELLYGFGVKVPKNKFEFTAEVYGNAFLKSPPVVAYSRENYAYLTPAVNYSALPWLGLSLGIDLRLLDSSDKTLYEPNVGGIKRTLPTEAQPNYAAWRINFGTRFHLNSSNTRSRDERQMLMQKASSRRELFEQIIKQQKGTQSAELELERIKEERIRAEKELERLRRILEGEVKEGANGEAKESKNKKGKN